MGIEEKTKDLTKAVTQLHNLESDNIRCVVVLLLECGNGGGGGSKRRMRHTIFVCLCMYRLKEKSDTNICVYKWKENVDMKCVCSDLRKIYIYVYVSVWKLTNLFVCNIDIKGLWVSRLKEDIDVKCLSTDWRKERHEMFMCVQTGGRCRHAMFLCVCVCTD